MLTPVILSGGAGTRLWPVSREAHPKPFMHLPDGQSLLQKTLARVAALADVGRIVTVTNRAYFFKTQDEYAALQAHRHLHFDYLLEPCGRNTAAAIAMAARYLHDSQGPEALMLVLPADHLISDQSAFAEAVTHAKQQAQAGYLVTFGIIPTHPETGFGYIETGVPLDASAPQQGALAQRFVEKPDLANAQQYLASGKHLWNSGMFCFKVSTLLAALQTHAADIDQAVLHCWENSDKTRLPIEFSEDFAQIPDLSIDYAVMEKSDQVVVIPGDFGWSDIGSWSAVSDLVEADARGNRTRGEVLLEDSDNCYIHSDGRLVAAIGVDNLIIVDTADALLVAHRDQVQDVKTIVQRLKVLDHEAYRLHRTVYRPWGTYTVLEDGEHFKIKRIVVKPGAALSLQMHHHRSEHWVVVSGTARVVNADLDVLIRTNESTYIPAGTPHRLTNPGVIDLVMIEVQSGQYLGEDDIVRFEDQYGRQ